MSVTVGAERRPTTIYRRGTPNPHAIAALAPVPWRGVLAVAALVGAVLLAISSRHGYHRDELYFRVAGQHLSWGYVDQPPFTPLVARLSMAVFGDTVWALRVVPAVAVGAIAVVAALLARELGGGRRGQVVAAAAVATGPFVLGLGHLLSTPTFDVLAWLVLIWVGARMVRTTDPRWWVAFGAATGLASLNKHLVVILAVAFVVALLVDRRVELLFTGWLPAGGAVAFVIALPHLVWQAQNDWPQLAFAGALADRIGAENRLLLLPGQVALAGVVLVPFLLAGVRWLWRDEHGYTFRPVLIAWVVAIFVTFATQGRPYYPLPLAIAVVVAGAVALERRRSPRWHVAFVGLGALTSAVFALPVLPLGLLAPISGMPIGEPIAETVGWPELAASVADVVGDLPAVEREQVVVLTASYGEAGAIERFGPDLGLPAPHSAHNHYWYWRAPTSDGATVVAVRIPREVLSRWFADCDLAGRVDNGHDIVNEAQDTPIHVCRGLRGAWSELWPEMRFLA